MFQIDLVTNRYFIECYRKFFISFVDLEDIDLDWDIEIAKYLNLSIKKYQKILLKNNAIITIVNLDDKLFSNCFFDNEEDGEKAIIDLEPYLVMKELLK